jgi:adenylate cyclase
MTAGSRRILLVEDDRYLRRAAETILRRRGYVVITATDGEQGLVSARAEMPDLIMLDLILPKVQGFEVLRQLKSDPATRDIPVIILSNLGGERDVEATLAAGAREYLVKVNLSMDDLAAAADRALGVAAP